MLKINKAENFDREGKYCHSNKWRPLWLRQVKENHCHWHQLPPRALCGPRSPPERSQKSWYIVITCYWIKTFFLAPYKPPWKNSSDDNDLCMALLRWQRHWIDEGDDEMQRWRRTLVRAKGSFELISSQSTDISEVRKEFLLSHLICNICNFAFQKQQKMHSEHMRTVIFFARGTYFRHK